MKKVICFVLLFCAFIVMAGFGRCGGRGSGSVGRKHAEEFMEYVQNKDVENLKDMFCNLTKNLDNFDEQIQDVIPSIKNVETDTGKSYKIWFDSYVVCKDNEDAVGINEISVKSEDNGDVFAFGVGLD